MGAEGMGKFSKDKEGNPHNRACHHMQGCSVTMCDLLFQLPLRASLRCAARGWGGD